MSHDSCAVANFLMERAKADNRTLTPMQIIKLVYISHGWMLGLYRRPLIRDRVEAWQYGPVIKKLYQKLKDYGSDHVTERIKVSDETFDEYESDLIEQVWGKYRHLTGIDLSGLTHAAGTPWDTAWSMTGQNTVISSDLIEDFFYKKGVYIFNKPIYNYYIIISKLEENEMFVLSKAYMYDEAAEFEFRYNHRVANGVDDAARAVKTLHGTVGKRVMYRDSLSA